MSKYILLTFFCLVFFSFQALAQQSSIHGNVVDQGSQSALEYANVLLYNSSDSSMVNGVITQSDGSFSLENIKAGNYYLEIKFVGYLTTKLEGIQLARAQKYEAGAITLQFNDQLLNEIEVRGEKAASYHKIDRQVFNAGQFKSAMGGTATDVLRNVPSVVVNADGDISVRGSSGFTILLNGKPIQSDASIILNQLPANAIEDVEIVTAPSAKYDPEGKAGIINIITRKGASDGLFLQFNAKIGMPSIEDYDNAESAPRYGGDFTLNYRKNKWDIALGASYLRNDIAGRRVGDVYTIINDTLTSFPSEGERSFDEKAYTGRATIGYTPDKKNSFSLGLYAGKRSKDRTADILYNNTKVYQPENEVLNEITYYNENLRIRRGDFFISSLDYAHAFKNKAQLKSSLLYEYTMLGGPTTNLNLEWPSLLDTLQDQYNANDNPLNGWRWQLDYSQPLGQGNLEIGYQYRSLDHEGEFYYEERPQGSNEYQLIPEFSSTVDLNRRIHSLYAQYGATYGKLSYTAGLRVEQMDRKLLLQNALVDSTYSYDFVKLYPSANLLYEWTDSFRMKAAYSKRVERTTTFKMNPFPEREHSETLEQGDAELLPEFIDLVELGVIKDFGNNSVFATAYFQHVQNLINRVNTIYNDSILNRIYSNVGKGFSLGLEGSAELNPTEWWQLYLGGNLYNYEIDGEFAGQNVNTRSWVYSINANTTFKLSPTLNIQWTLNYLSDRNTAQGKDSRFLSPNLSVQKSFLDNRLSATLQWLNMDMGLLPTNEQRITTWRDTPALRQEFYTTTNYIYEVDVIMLNLSYRINQLNGKAKFIKSEFGEKEF